MTGGEGGGGTGVGQALFKQDLCDLAHAMAPMCGQVGHTRHLIAYTSISSVAYRYQAELK